MPGRIVATAHWRRLDVSGTDRCSLSRADHGWLLSGQANWHEPGCDASLVYVIRCDRQWNPLSADVAGIRAGAPVRLRLHAGPRGWLLNDVPQPETDPACTDLDFSFTPATNLPPLRRLGTSTGAVRTAAAWLGPSLDRLERLEQLYARHDDGTVEYTSPGFRAVLDLHPSGFVTRYPGLCNGWVDD